MGGLDDYARVPGLVTSEFLLQGVTSATCRTNSWDGERVPEVEPGALPFVLGLPFLVLGGIALVELAGVPAGERRGLWLGQTALSCPWLIAALAIPIFVAALWALRRLAPTRQRLAGFSAGCLAGAAAAVLYALHCNENAAAFVVSWYTVGILLPGLVGILIGPRVLHW
jgi:hypothetical protein